MPKYLLTILLFFLISPGVEAQIIIVPQSTRTSNNLNLGGETIQVRNAPSFYGPTNQVQRDDAWTRYLQLSNTSNGERDSQIAPSTNISPSIHGYELGDSNVNPPISPPFNLSSIEPARVGVSQFQSANPNYRETPTTHTVAKGETLYAISKQYDVSVEAIQNWNDLNLSIIKPGQVLKVAAPATVASYEQMDRAVMTDYSNIHVVGPGETVASLALKYGYTSSRFRSINDLGPNDYLRVGQRIKTTHCDCSSQAITSGQNVTTSVTPNSYNRTGERVSAYYTSPVNYASQSKRGFYQSVFLAPTTQYQTNKGGPYFYYETDQSAFLNELQNLIYFAERSVYTARQSQYQAIFGGSPLADQRSDSWTYAQQNLVNTKVMQQSLTASDRSQLAMSYQKLNGFYQSLRQQQAQLQGYNNSRSTYLSTADYELLGWLLGNGAQMLTAIEQSLYQIEALYTPHILDTSYAGLIDLLARLKATEERLLFTPTFAQSPEKYQATALAGLQLLLNN
jgi:LysM repeat protein